MSQEQHPLVAAVSSVVDAFGATIVPVSDTGPSDIPLEWEGVIIAAVRMPALHGALDRLIESVEKELGGSLRDLSRNDKQRAIRMLDERGAFILRRAVEDVADAMSVSRITVYNYLNAIHR
jgi:HTH domain